MYVSYGTKKEFVFILIRYNLVLLRMIINVRSVSSYSIEPIFPSRKKICYTLDNSVLLNNKQLIPP